MDPSLAVVWIVRLLFLGCIYLFLIGVIRVLLRDLRTASRQVPGALGRLVVTASETGEPLPGATFQLDAVATIGRDVNNSIVVDDPFASAEHAVLTFRGRAWYLEDLASTNGTWVNGQRVEGLAVIAFGDQFQVGRAQFRLERAGATKR